MRWQAVHEEGVGLRHRHHFVVDTPVDKGFQALFVLCLEAHAGPHVGGHQMRTFAGFQGVVEDAVAAGVFDARGNGVNLVAAGCAYMHFETHHLGRLQPRVGHVVAIAHPGHDLAFDVATVLDVSKDVGQDLAGVVLVGQAIDDGHA